MSESEPKASNVIPLSAQVMWNDAKLRRDELTEKGLCINGETHGPPVAGGRRCAWCRDVHRRGVLAVLADETAPPQPPGYRFKERRDLRLPRQVRRTK